MKDIVPLQSFATVLVGDWKSVAGQIHKQTQNLAWRMCEVPPIPVKAAQ